MPIIKGECKVNGKAAKILDVKNNAKSGTVVAWRYKDGGRVTRETLVEFNRRTYVAS